MKNHSYSKREISELKKLMKEHGLKPSKRQVRKQLQLYGDQTLEEFQRRSRERERVRAERKLRSEMKMQENLKQQAKEKQERLEQLTIRQGLKDSFHTLHGLGRKKHSASIMEKEYLIFSKGTWEKYKLECEKMTEYLENRGIIYFKDLKREHFLEYFEVRSAGLKESTIVNLESKLIKISNGVEKFVQSEEAISTLYGDKLGYFTKDDRGSYNANTSRAMRSYSKEEANRILDELRRTRPGAFRGVVLSRIAGLRAEEASLIEKRHFQWNEERQAYDIVIHSGDRSHVTKANRYRYIPVASKWNDYLREELGRLKNETDRLCPTTKDYLNKSVNAVIKRLGIHKGDRGAVHGFRHLYARERFLESIQNDPTVLDATNRIVDNLHQGFRANKGFQQDDPSYEKAIKAMDQVHGELGHGKERFNLAKTYLDFKNYSV